MREERYFFCRGRKLTTPEEEDPGEGRRSFLFLLQSMG